MNLRIFEHVDISLYITLGDMQRRRNGCQVSFERHSKLHKVCTWCSCMLMRELDFNTIFTLPVYAMGPFTSRVPFIPLTRHTNSELSTLPVDATHASSAENLTALTWLLWPLNLAEPAPLATHG